jgi:hypothetical protein
VLDGVLRLLLAAEEVTREREHAGGVALEDHLERRLVAAADLVHQALVARERQEPLGRERLRAARGGGEGNGFHVGRVVG